MTSSQTSASMPRLPLPPSGELEMKAIYVFALMFIWIQIVSGSDEKGVAKIAKERNEDAPSGDSDHELPSRESL